MSSRHERLPQHIDPFRFAEAERQLEGTLPLSQMKRLGPMLASTTDKVVVILVFGVDAMGVHYAQGEITAELKITCQRCLEPMDWQVKTELMLGFVRSVHDAERMPGPYEPYIVESVPVAMIDLIEDELILALPQIPMHSIEDCPARTLVQHSEEGTGRDNQASRDNPFSVLARKDTE